MKTGEYKINIFYWIIQLEESGDTESLSQLNKIYLKGS
jgi:hypothetical protein